MRSTESLASRTRRFWRVAGKLERDGEARVRVDGCFGRVEQRFVHAEESLVRGAGHVCAVHGHGREHADGQGHPAYPWRGPLPR